MQAYWRFCDPQKSTSSCHFVFLCRLVGDILICCGFLSYAGPFNQDFRILLNKNWMKELKNRKIPLSTQLNPVDMLVDPTTVRKKSERLLVRMDECKKDN